jgi:hypothetical protein
MDYAFKNSPKDHLTQMVLGENGFKIILDGATYNYKYSDVTRVWLNNPEGFIAPGEYSCTINIVDKKPIYITSKNFDQNGLFIEQSHHYNTFVRVLHMHIKSNKAAEFKFGTTPAKYFRRVAIIALILTACVASIITFKSNPFYFIVPSVFGVFVTIYGLQFCITRFPKVYNPDNIPLELLPA